MVNKKMTEKKKFPTWGIVLIIVGALVVILVGWWIGTYNGLVRAGESVDKDAAQIETQLQRRMDLIPNLVSTVKGYAAHESETFKAVSDARSRLAGAVSSGDMAQISSANDSMNSALSRLLAISEAYPELKANESFIGLQDELAGTENRINQARQEYNDTVADYNKTIKVFPKMIVAGMGGFGEKDYFEADEGASEVPEVEF